jgi:hypothetical protein
MFYHCQTNVRIQQPLPDSGLSAYGPFWSFQSYPPIGSFSCKTTEQFDLAQARRPTDAPLP